MQVPPLTHPTWTALVTGASKVQLEYLAARLLLVRARMEVMRAQQDNAAPLVTKKWVNDLRDLYVKNAESPSAQLDLARLFS